jgi:hypothetical protein
VDLQTGRRPSLVAKRKCEIAVDSCEFFNQLMRHGDTRDRREHHASPKGKKKRKPFQHQQAVETARRNEDTCRTRSNTNSKQHARAKSHKEEKTKQVAVTLVCETAPLSCEHRRRRRPTPIELEQMHAIHAESRQIETTHCWLSSFVLFSSRKCGSASIKGR